MKKLVMSLSVLALCLAIVSQADAGADHNYIPPNGYISSEKVAVNIAEIILKSIYGEDQIEAEKPLNAELVGEVWIIRGTLAPELKGGVAEIRISKKTGKIIRVTHGK